MKSAGVVHKPNSVPPGTGVAIIHLRSTLPSTWCDLPGSGSPLLSETKEVMQDGPPAIRFPIWSCSAWGLPCLEPSPAERCALTAPFHPYPDKPGGLLSVALSVASPRLAVSEHAARRSSDFPPYTRLPDAKRSPESLRHCLFYSRKSVRPGVSSFWPPCR